MGGVEVLLREQDFDIIGHALAVTGVCKVKAALLCLHKTLLRGQFVIYKGADGERIGYFAESDLDGAFVIRDFDLFANLRGVEIGAISTALKNGNGDLGREIPGGGRAGEEIG